MGADAKLQTTGGTTYPDWVNEASQDFYGASKDYAPGQYTGDLVAPLSPYTTAGMEQLGGLSAPTFDSQYLGKAGGALDAISGERIVDENGFLGSIEDYSYPFFKDYMSSVYQQMDDSNKRFTSQQAQRRGQYGGRGPGEFDAREENARIQEQEAYSRSVGDVGSKAAFDAYGTAMGLRGDDLSRQGGISSQYASLAGAETTQAAAAWGAKQEEINARLMAGQIDQQQAQNELDAELMRFQMDEAAEMQNLAVWAQGMGFDVDVAELGPKDYPILKILGAVAGSFFGAGGFNK